MSRSAAEKTFNKKEIEMCKVIKKDIVSLEHLGLFDVVLEKYDTLPSVFVTVRHHGGAVLGGINLNVLNAAAVVANITEKKWNAEIEAEKRIKRQPWREHEFLMGG